MCTTISLKQPITGSGKSTQGWFSIDHAYLGYDHPSHAQVEHAVLLDFVSEAAGPHARVAVELPLEAARALAAQLMETIAQAEAYEAA